MIDRDKDNIPSFRTHTFRTDHQRYFYPASTVKMPVALLALEKLNSLNLEGLDRTTRMQTDSVRPPQSVAVTDTSAPDGVPSVAHYVKKIFVASDNDAYNRLYEFLGQADIQNRLRSKGLVNTRIIHRLSDPRFGPEENRYTNPVAFFNFDTLVYTQEEKYASQLAPLNITGEQKGVGYINAQGDPVQEPFDFSQKNYFPLEDQILLIKSIFFPEHVDSSARLQITSDDLRYVRQCMSMLPRESNIREYQSDEFYDGHVKFFMYGDKKDRIPDNIKIFNKVGWAYGYLTDCAYIIDTDTGVEFMLAATVHVNANQIFNDGVYEYDEIGIPYLAALGRAVYNYELQRNRKRPPDFGDVISQE